MINPEQRRKPKTHDPRVIVVTGADAGVGRATVRRFAAAGEHIGLIGRDLARLEQTAEEVHQLGGRAQVALADVADANQVEAAAAGVEEAFGHIDVWINNAMATIYSPFRDISAEDYRRATEVTYLGTVYGTMAALRRMQPRNKGRIIQVGSALAYRAIPLQSPYCGAKFAIRGFTDALRSELLHDRSRIGLTMVHLPALNTPQFDWGRNHLRTKPQPVPPIFQPEMAAKAIDWASRHTRREVYVGLPTIRAIWVNKFFPGLIDRYLAHFGYSGQQSREPADPKAPDNLWEPVEGDFAAHGRFGRRARRGGLQLWISLYREPLMLGFAAAALGGGLYWFNRHRPAAVRNARTLLPRLEGD